jgi:hypothetical protein
MRILFTLLLFVGCGGSDSPPPTDMAGVMTNADALKPFGAVCTMDSECQGGKCFIGGSMSFCTMPCTMAGMMNDPLCPNPPTSGMCNMKGFCKP